MSTKTSIKRIALVAVAALSLGMVSTIAANAANDGTWSYTTMYDATNGLQIVGGEATLTLDGAGSTNYTITAEGGSGILTVSTANDGDSSSTLTKLNGTSYAAGVRWAQDDAGDDLKVTVTSAAVGTVKVSATPVDAGTGVPGTAKTKTVTFIAAASTDLSSANTQITITKSAATCVSSATKSTETAGLVTNARTSLSYRDVTAGNDRNAFVCVIARDGNDNRIAFGDLDQVIVTTSIGSFDNGAIDRSSVAGDFHTNADTYAADLQLFGDAIAPGVSSVSVTIIEGTTTVTKTLSFTYFGKIASIALTNSTTAVSAGGYGLDYTDDTSATTKAQTTVAFTVACKDANGATVSGCDYDGDGDYTADDEGSFYVVVNSDKVAGSPAFSAAAPASATEAGAPAATLTLDTTAVSAVDGVYDYITVDSSSALLASQKLDFTLYVKNAAETSPTASISATGTYYVSGAAAKVVVTPTATELDKGGNTTVTATVTDAAGYPVADGTSVTFAATDNGVIAGSSKTTDGGSASTIFVASNTAGTSTVSALAGKVSGSSSISIGGGSSESSSAIDAANEATDAANAATDAANAAAEAADAATAAAQDAQAAVAALATQVSSLIAGIKAQITSLTNLVIKIQKKVKA